MAPVWGAQKPKCIYTGSDLSVLSFSSFSSSATLLYGDMFSTTESNGKPSLGTSSITMGYESDRFREHEFRQSWGFGKYPNV